MTQKNNFFLPWGVVVSVQAVLFFCTGLLWLLCSGTIPGLSQVQWISLVRNSAAPFITLTLAICFCSTAFILHTRFGTTSFRTRLGYHSLFTLYTSTLIPLGYYAKTGAFFFENWAWIATVWILCSSLVLLLFLHPATQEYCSRRIHAPKQWRFTLLNTNYVYCIALATFLLCLTFNLTLFSGMPHIVDSQSQWFQASVFLHGSLAASLPAASEFFEHVFLLSVEDRWFSIYPPGYALLLSLGMWIGVPGLINALLTTASGILLYRITRNRFNEATARWAISLWMISPFVLFMGAGFMNHTANAFWFLLTILCMQQLQRHPWYAPLGGIAVGMGMITRPFSTLALSFCLPLWITWTRGIPRRKLVSSIILFSLGALLPILFFLHYNLETTGNAFLSGYQMYFGGTPVGFGERPWGSEPLAHGIANTVTHSPIRGAINTWNNFTLLQYHLLGWPTGSLLCVFLLFLPGMHMGRNEMVVLLSALTLPLAYFFYFFQDDCFGPRFYFETAPFWIMLIARCLSRLPQAMTGWYGNAHQTNQAIVLFFVTLLTIISLFTVWMERIAVYGDSYWGTISELRTLVHETITTNDSVIFVEDYRDFQTLFTMNDPTLTRGPVIARDMGVQNQSLMEHYPGWEAWRLTFVDNEQEGIRGNILVRLSSPDTIPNP